MPLRRYIVHCADADSPRTRWVEGVTVEDAALAFLSEWNPAAPHEVVGLIVCHAANGEEHSVSVDRRRYDHPIHA